MVKPPRTMQPEKVDLKKASRAAGNAFAEDSFHNYMARKIDLQRKQFGVELPPDPQIQQQYQQLRQAQQEAPPKSSKQQPSLVLHDSPKRKSPKRNQHVSFAQDVVDHDSTTRSKKKRKHGSMTSILKKLKRRHGKGLSQKSIRRRRSRDRDKQRNTMTGDEQNSAGFGEQIVTSSVALPSGKSGEIEHIHQSNQIDCVNESNYDDGIASPQQSQSSKDCEHFPQDTETLEEDQAQQQPTPPTRRQRADLFFLGVVIMVNGYTNPDTESLQRIIHRHGGDLEKYETSRITHIIAEHLSFAKANIYKNRRKPIPVCRPSWIVDSVQAQRLLPYGDYLIDEVRDKAHGETSMKDYFSVASTATKTGGSSTCGRARSGDEHEFSEVQPNAVLHSTTPISSTRHDYRSPDKPTSPTHTTPLGGSQLPESGQIDILPRKQPTVPLVDNENRHRETGISIGSPTFELMEEDPDNGDGSARICTAENNNLQGSDPSGGECHNPPSGTLEAECGSLENTGTRSSDRRLEDALGQGVDSGETTTVREHGDNNGARSQLQSNEEDQPHRRSSAISRQEDICAHSNNGRTDDKYIDGQLRTTGTDPNFLDTFFSNSRLSFIGSYKQRTKESPKKARGVDLGETERFVMHCDMDCFFAMVVLRNYPEYQNKPVAISHFGKKNGEQNAGQPKKNSSSECATCNYEARKFGIKKGMFLGRAKELCPDLIVLPYDFQGYEEVSEQVAVILQRFADEFNGEVEQVSCDEAYLELILPKINGSDPCRHAGEIANDIRKTILATTRCTATVGVSTNKFLAKLATDRVKPNGSFVVRNPTGLLRTLRLRDLHGVGWRTEPKLKAEGLVTVEDVWNLGNAAEGVLCRVLGPGLGKKILAFCQGKDDRCVKAAERKTIGAECNYGVRFDGPYGVDHLIAGLAKEVQKRMQNVGVYGNRVTLKVKQRKEGAKAPPKFLGHGSCHNLSKSLDSTEGPTRDWKIICCIGTALFHELGVHTDDVRGMGLVLSKLSATCEASNGLTTSNQSIKNWFGNTDGNQQSDVQTLTIPTKTRGGRTPINPSAISAGQSEVDGTLPSDSPGNLQGDPKDDVKEASIAHLEDGSVEQPDEFTKEGQPDDVGVCDVELPSMSQLHMSQVAALPAPMQDQINRKIADRKTKLPSKTGSSPQTGTRASADDGQNRFRQVSVKRMLRLAAIKSGNSKCDNGDGNAVAVRELECLPLEMQLQLANNDRCSIGSRSRKISRGTEAKGRARVSRKRRCSSSAKTNRQSSSNVQSTNKKQTQRMSVQRPGSGEEIISQPKEGTADNAMPQSESADSPLPGSFFEVFEDDISPLSAFLDDHRDPNPESVSLVKQLLAKKVSERQTYETMLLLRNIYNRRDNWSKNIFCELWRAVDDACQAVEGYRLDREGMGFV